MLRWVLAAAAALGAAAQTTPAPREDAAGAALPESSALAAPPAAATKGVLNAYISEAACKRGEAPHLSYFATGAAAWGVDGRVVPMDAYGAARSGKFSGYMNQCVGENLELYWCGTPDDCRAEARLIVLETSPLLAGACVMDDGLPSGGIFAETAATGLWYKIGDPISLRRFDDAGCGGQPSSVYRSAQRFSCGARCLRLSTESEGRFLSVECRTSPEGVEVHFAFFRTTLECSGGGQPTSDMTIASQDVAGFEYEGACTSAQGVSWWTLQVGSQVFSELEQLRADAMQEARSADAAARSAAAAASAAARSSQLAKTKEEGARAQGTVPAEWADTASAAPAGRVAREALLAAAAVAVAACAPGRRA